MEISLEPTGGISWITGPLIPARKRDERGVGSTFVSAQFNKKKKAGKVAAGGDDWT